MRRPLVFLALTLTCWASPESWKLPASEPPGLPVFAGRRADERVEVGRAGETVWLDPARLPGYEKGQLPLRAVESHAQGDLSSQLVVVGPEGSSEVLLVWVKVLFLSEPSDAEVVPASGDASAGEHLLEVVRSGQLARLRMRPNDRFRLEFRKSGYRPTTVEVDNRILAPVEYQGQRVRIWPRPEPLVLAPEGANILLHPLRAHPLASGLSLAVLLGGLGMAAWRYRSEKRKSWRGKQLETMRVDGRDALVGSALGPWRIAERVGAGGMATVYRAVPDATLDERESVAIKVIQGAYASDPEFVARFKREYRVLCSLSHPNILRIQDCDEQEGLHYMVMEFVRGQTLTGLLRPEGLAPERVHELLRPVVLGLQAAHGRGIVHRDLKPDNLMLTDLGQVKIMDFGLARSEELSRLTQSGAALGTPAYMAPEQVTGAEPDPRSDQYALGVILYEMLTGRRPFEGSDPMQVVLKHVQEPVPSPRLFKPELSEQWEQVLRRMLDKDPARRYADLGAVAQAWELALAGKLPPEPAHSSAPRAERRMANSSGTSAEESDSTIQFQAPQSP